MRLQPLNKDSAAVAVVTFVSTNNACAAAAAAIAAAAGGSAAVAVGDFPVLAVRAPGCGKRGDAQLSGLC